MAYHLSAAKLQAYNRCPQAYYFQYERGISGAPFFNSASLGTALHRTLAQIYRDWHYQEPLPSTDWIDHCWSQHLNDLTTAQMSEGRSILRGYYQRFVANRTRLIRPLAVEGKIQGRLQVENLEFVLTGRYDRLDWIEDGLELIDYKSSKEFKALEPAEVNLQLGLYYLALEQRYLHNLKRLTLVHLRSGQQMSYQVTSDHKQQVEQKISQLALRLRADHRWEPLVGTYCQHCTYARYCPAMQPQPEPLPEDVKLNRSYS